MNRKTFLKCGFFAPAGLQSALGKDFSAAPKKYDVIVAGGGPAGFSAAIAAAECGAKTLLIEDSGELGGAGGSGCVNHWLGGRTTNAQKFAVGGIFKRIVLQAEKEKIARVPTHCGEKYPPFGWARGALFAGIPFDGSRMAELLDRKVLESGAMVEGRRQAVELLRIMKAHFPGFENARISRIAPKLGVRETRRISGEYTLKVSDLASEVNFDDTIGFSCYSWDLPDPDKPSHQPMRGKKMRKGHLVPLPFRIMVPRKISNLTCPGRCVSAERQALGAVRVMAPCMAMGEAAGVNAATGLCGEELRKKLRERGCIVDSSEIL